MNLLEQYQNSDIIKKVKLVKNVYNSRNCDELYSTSPDINLRELEILFIINNIISSTSTILDIGCGNGYTGYKIHKKYNNIRYTGIDFAENMITAAIKLNKLNSNIFEVKNILEDSIDKQYDIIISERLIQNLPNTDLQYNTINKIASALNPGGIYLMVEGTKTGLDKLNAIRTLVGLQEIPDTAEYNISALRFNETELEDYISKFFYIDKKQYFGTYYLISRVFYPLFIHPDNPKYVSKFNEIASIIQSQLLENETNSIGHVCGYVLRKK